MNTAVYSCSREGRRARPRLFAVGIVMSLILSGLSTEARAATQSYTEDFTTTTYKDETTTTADWNTTAGELRLFPFAPYLYGSYHMTGYAYSVAVAGDRAFVANAEYGLQVIDITDPANPVLAGSYDTPSSAWGVAIAGNHAFLADDASGLQVIDISDPSSPVLAGSYDTGNAYGVAVAGDHAFVADWFGGLAVIDISDPTSPVLAGDYDTPGFALDVAIAGDHAFVADYGSGLLVIDITDPANPVFAGSFDTPGIARRIVVAGDHAYLADHDSGLQVIDISDPTNPVLAGSFDTPESARGIAVAGDLAYLAASSRGLQVIDISDPSSPVLAGSYDTPGIAYGVTVAGDLAFVADGTGGLQVLRVGVFVNPLLAGSDQTPGTATDVTVAGDHAFVADFTSGLRVVDISDPSSPVPAGSYNTPGWAQGVAVSGDHAFIADGHDGMQVVDISDPSNPVLAGTFPITGGEAFGVAIAGDLAYLAADDSGLWMIDISDPTDPAMLSVTNSQGRTFDVAIAGDYAFLAHNYEGLIVYDISDPSYVDFAGQCDTPGWARDVAVAGDYAFVADYGSGLQVIDISDPSNPVLAGSYDTPSDAIGVAVVGDLAFVADGASGLQVIDISDPTSPVLAGMYDTASLAISVAVAGDHAFVADYDGLELIQAYQHETDVSRNTGQSLAVDGTSDMIPRARLVSTETPSVSWELSADAGADWTAFTPDAAWERITVPGEDLVWRTTHTWSPGVNPTVSDLTIDWLNEFGPITSITDVPDDQGGWVRLSFTRSGYDFADETGLPVTGYQVHRRVDDQAFTMRILEEGSIPSGPEVEGTMLASFEPEVIRTLDGRDFLLGGSEARGEFPPGTWEAVATVFATQQELYTVAVPTLADSTGEGGVAWSVHFVTTHTTTPSIWFASAPDSGYSVDNIAPGVPQNLVFGEPGVLEWDEASEEDFVYHTVYGSESEIFDETATLLGYSVEPTYDVSGDPYGYYHVTTSDDADNESEAATIQSPTTSAQGGNAVPTVFALHAARPNPFQVGTSIGFDLPEGSDLRLSIFDATGRRVRVMIDDHQPAGRHQISWDGTNEGGQRVAPGIYFARIAGRNFEASRRLVLVR